MDQLKINSLVMAAHCRDIEGITVMPLESLTTHLALRRFCLPHFCRKRVIRLSRQRLTESILVLLLPQRRNDQVNICRQVLPLLFGDMLILGTHQ